MSPGPAPALLLPYMNGLCCDFVEMKNPNNWRQNKILSELAAAPPRSLSNKVLPRHGIT